MIALAISAITALFLLQWRGRPPELTELTERVRSTDSALTDLEDRVTHWMRRGAVRKMREATDETLVASNDPKAALRARAAQLRIASRG